MSLQTRSNQVKGIQIPLRFILIVPFILQIFTAVGLVGWLSFRNGQQAVNNVASQLRSEVTNRIQEQVRVYIETPHLVNSINANAIRLGFLDGNIPRLEQYLWAQLQQFKEVSYIGFGFETAEYIGIQRLDNGAIRRDISGRATDYHLQTWATNNKSNRTELLTSKPNYNPQLRPWYKVAVQANKPAWSKIYAFFTSKKLSIAANQPFYNSQGKLLGVATTDLTLSHLSELLSRIKVGQTGQTFIMEKSGLLVATSTFEKPFRLNLQQQPERLQAVKSSNVLTRATANYLKQNHNSNINYPNQLEFALNGKRQFLQVTPLKDDRGIDWLVIVVVPEADFMQQINANTRTTIWLCLGALGLATGLGILTSRWITQPLRRLSEAAIALSNGKWNQAVPSERRDELGILARTFNQMREQLQKSHVQLEEYSRSLEQKVEERTQALQQEIRDRIAAEAAHAAAEAELRALLAAMTEAIFVFDSRGRYLKVAPTNNQSLQYKPTNEIIGKTLHDIFPAEQADFFLSYIQTTLETRQTVNFEYSLTIETGEIWFDCSISPISDDSALWVARHITERKLAVEAIQRAKEAAENANRAKSEFLANMSHELRTPLNTILGFTQLMTRDRSINPTQLEQLGIISRSGEHLLSLINDVLSMSKIEAGRTTLNENSFDLYYLLDSLKETFQLKAESKGLQFLFERSSEVPQYVLTDESKLRQVLINLLGNAIKFTQEGSLTLRVRQEVAQVRQNAQSSSCFIHFEVEDTGPGIAPTELESLFRPFVQTETGRRSQQGTGLGLTISQQFVCLMGGEIAVSSTLGQGTVFTFDIQVALAAATEVKTQRSAGDGCGGYAKEQALKQYRRAIALEPGQPKYRILVVEDKWENRQLLVKMLALLGFEVREAENGQEGVELWETWKPHLIWMDMRMPVMDGYEATRRIKSHLKGQATIIIALTASAFDEERTVVLSAGCDDFVYKPFQEEVIFEKMAKHLGVRYVSEEEAPQNDLGENFQLEHSSLKQALAQMPSQWVAQLHQAALCTDEKLIFSLIEQIPEESAPLATALADLVNNFRIDQIIDLTQPDP